MKTNRLFWRFAAVLTLLFWGGLIRNPLFVGSGISLILFWTASKQINRWALPTHRKPYKAFLTLLCCFLPLSFAPFFAAMFGFTGLLWTGYAVTARFNNSHQTKLTGQRRSSLPNLADLKHMVKQLDDKVKQLKELAASNQHQTYRQLANDVLADLDKLDHQLREQQATLEQATYQRLTTRVQTERQIIQETLDKIERSWETALPAHQEIERLAPEMSQIFAQISQDSQLIKQQIKTSQTGNQAELLELHDTNMRRFSRILSGYLAIKEHPNHYYDAEQRLTTAQTTMTQFAHDLKEQLKQLNENAMHEFEVNLRLLNSKL